MSVLNMRMYQNGNILDMRIMSLIGFTDSTLHSMLHF